MGNGRRLRRLAVCVQNLDNCKRKMAKEKDKSIQNHAERRQSTLLTSTTAAGWDVIASSCGVSCLRASGKVRGFMEVGEEDEWEDWVGNEAL